MTLQEALDTLNAHVSQQGPRYMSIKAELTQNHTGSVDLTFHAYVGYNDVNLNGWSPSCTTLKEAVQYHLDLEVPVAPAPKVPDEVSAAFDKAVGRK